jgi:DNA-binding NarL/FixJ family response regulator
MTQTAHKSRELAHDRILMDIRMPELDGLSATGEILRHANPPAIVVLTTFDQNEYVYRALRAGAAGFLLKDPSSTRLIAAVRAAATGDSLIDPAITRRLVEHFVVPRRDVLGAGLELTCARRSAAGQVRLACWGREFRCGTVAVAGRG